MGRTDPHLLAKARDEGAGGGVVFGARNMGGRTGQRGVSHPPRLPQPRGKAAGQAQVAEYSMEQRFASRASQFAADQASSGFAGKQSTTATLRGRAREPRAIAREQQPCPRANHRQPHHAHSA